MREGDISDCQQRITLGELARGSMQRTGIRRQKGEGEEKRVRSEGAACGHRRPAR